MKYNEIKKDLIHPWEKPMRAVNILIFILAIIGTIIAIMGVFDGAELIGAVENEEAGGKLLLIGGVAAVLIQLGRQYGKSRANSVRLNDNQFPEIYEIVKLFSEKLELGYVPEVYLTQEGGMLNAFATSFFARKYISINSAIFEIAYLEHKDINTVAFVIGHELTHLKRKHATTGMVLIEMIAQMIPIWGAAQSRAKEYTCDRHAAWLIPEGKEGLILLATGKHLYKHVNIDEYIKTSSQYKGFFYWLYNLLATHPAGPKRMKALYDNSNRGKIF